MSAATGASSNNTEPRMKFRGINAPPELFDAVIRKTISAERAWLVLVIGCYVEMKGEGCFATEEVLGEAAGKKARQIENDLNHLRGRRRNPDTGKWERDESMPRYIRIAGWKELPNGACLKILETKWARIDEDLPWSQAQDVPHPYRKQKTQENNDTQRIAEGGSAPDCVRGSATDCVHINKVKVEGIGKPSLRKPDAGASGPHPAQPSANRISGNSQTPGHSNGKIPGLNGQPSRLPDYGDNGLPGYCYSLADRLHAHAEKALNKAIKYPRKSWAAAFYAIAKRCKGDVARLTHAMGLLETYGGEPGWPPAGIKHPNGFENRLDWLEEAEARLNGEHARSQQLKGEERQPRFEVIEERLPNGNVVRRTREVKP